MMMMMMIIIIIIIMHENLNVVYWNNAGFPG